MSATSVNAKIKISQAISLVGYLLLIALLLWSTYQFPPPKETSLAMVLAVKLLPLLILLPGLVKDSLRAHIWLCFILLLYFTQAVLSVTQHEGHRLFESIGILTIVVFLSSMMHVHWSKKAGVPLNPLRIRPHQPDHNQGS